MDITFSDEVVGFARDLLLSLWAELGVDGAPRRHEWQALDLEPLIVFTALVADSRLRARTIDWCAVNSRYLSLARLNHFSWLFGRAPHQAFKRYADAVSRGARPAAPTATPGRPRRARAGATPDLRRPALIQLRLRALAGVGARAEVLKLMLAEPQAPKTAASMVEAAGYGKNGLAQALDMLTVAGLASTRTEGKRILYRLNRPSELAQAVSGLPARFPDWPAVLRVVETITAYAKATAAQTASRFVQAEAAVEKIRGDMARIPGASPPAPLTDEGSVGGFERWAREFVAEQAGANLEPGRKREVVYTVHRLLLGGWIATVKEEGDQPRPLALSDDPELHEDRRARRRLKLDELGAAAEVIESMFCDIRARDLQRRRGSVVPRDAVADALLPAMSREFAAELLAPMHKGQAATFTEEFLQRWSANRHQRFSAAG